MQMAGASLLALIIVGGIAGWLAGIIVKVRMGIVGNIVTGVLGAFVAAVILPKLGLGFGGGLVAAILHATLGAVILLFLVKLAGKR